MPSIAPGQLVRFIDYRGTERRGRVVIVNPDGYLTVNVGGRHGTPVVVHVDSVLSQSGQRACSGSRAAAMVDFTVTTVFNGPLGAVYQQGFSAEGAQREVAVAQRSVRAVDGGYTDAWLLTVYQHPGWRHEVSIATKRGDMPARVGEFVQALGCLANLGWETPPPSGHGGSPRGRSWHRFVLWALQTQPGAAEVAAFLADQGCTVGQARAPRGSRAWLLPIGLP
jgi:hypothetical protein